MPILPPETIEMRPAAPVAAPDILDLSPRQVAESDWATKQRWARLQQAIAQQAADAADQRSQDVRFMDTLTQNARVGNAEKAVTAALRFQGVRGFERDVSAARASGLSAEQATVQALMRNAGRMFAENPGDIAPSIRQLMPPRSVAASNGIPAHIIAGNRPYFPPASATAVEFPPRVETLSDGTKVLRTGPQRSQALPSREPTVSNKITVLNARARSLENRLVLATGAARKKLEEQLDAVQSDLAALIPPTSAPPPDASPVEAPTAPAVPSPAAGATISPAPAAPVAPAADGFIIIRNRNTGVRKRYPAARAAELRGDPTWELAK